MIFDLAELMQVVQEEVIERFDHKHLNRETEEFHNLNPTGENIVHVIWNLLQPRLGTHLSTGRIMGDPRRISLNITERTRKQRG